MLSLSTCHRMARTHSYIIEEYKPPLTEEDIDFQVLGEVTDKEKFLEESLKKLEKQLGKDRDEFVYLPKWREILLFLEKPEDSHYNGNTLSLKFGIGTSFENQALRKGLLEELFIPAGVLGVLVSSDDKIVLGKRKGEVKSGNLSIAPAGLIGYEKTYSRNPLSDTFYGELQSETGLSEDDIESLSLIGLQYESFSLRGLQYDGYDYIFKARSSKTFNEIVESYKRAEESCEHEKLISVSNDPSKILDFIKNPSYPVLDICSNSLKAYLNSQK